MYRISPVQAISKQLKYRINCLFTDTFMAIETNFDTDKVPVQYRWIKKSSK